MKLTSHSFTSDVPPEKICRPGVEYQVRETDVTPDEALAFFGELLRPRDSFYLETPECLLHFWKHERAIWVEVTSPGLWATSEVSLAEAQAIIEAVDRGVGLDGRIPAGGREWDAYSLPWGGTPDSHAAI